MNIASNNQNRHNPAAFLRRIEFIRHNLETSLQKQNLPGLTVTPELHFILAVKDQGDLKPLQEVLRKTPGFETQKSIYTYKAKTADEKQGAKHPMIFPYWLTTQAKKQTEEKIPNYFQLNAVTQKQKLSYSTSTSNLPEAGD